MSEMISKSVMSMSQGCFEQNRRHYAHIVASLIRNWRLRMQVKERWRIKEHLSSCANYERMANALRRFWEDVSNKDVSNNRHSLTENFGYGGRAQPARQARRSRRAQARLHGQGKIARARGERLAARGCAMRASEPCDGVPLPL